MKLFQFSLFLDWIGLPAIEQEGDEKMTKNFGFLADSLSYLPFYLSRQMSSFFPLKYKIKIKVYLHCTFLTNLSVICPETTLPNIPPISRKLIAMLPTNIKNKKGSISEHEWTVLFFGRYLREHILKASIS